MKDSSTQSNVRWGELYPALSKLAEAEGRTRAEIARAALRAYLADKDIAVPCARSKPTTMKASNESMNVRWGELLEHIEVRAAAEDMTCSAIARRAVRLYLANGEVPKILQFMDELRQHHANLARIGGNLNRITRLINMDGVLAKSDLGQVHLALIEAFKPLANLCERVEIALERQRP